VMREQFESWRRSSHHAVAVCNDCHTPPGLAPKYFTKAQNGFFHSLAFTTGQFPDEIQITSRNHRIAESSCMKCHAEVVQGIQGTRGSGSGVACTQCHSRVGHQ
jgi:cytochrome c nitrite reductase small subunit